MTSLSIYILFIVILVIALLVLNKLFAISNTDPQKVSYYECGFESYYLMNRTPVSIIYYIIAIIFMVFDIEILFVYPFIASTIYISIYGYYIFIIFFTILTIGLVYEYSKNVLHFNYKLYFPL